MEHKPCDIPCGDRCEVKSISERALCHYIRRESQLRDGFCFSIYSDSDLVPPPCLYLFNTDNAVDSESLLHFLKRHKLSFRREIFRYDFPGSAPVFVLSDLDDYSYYLR